MVALRADAGTGPMPGMVISRFATGSALAATAMSVSIALIASSRLGDLGDQRQRASAHRPSDVRMALVDEGPQAAHMASALGDDTLALRIAAVNLKNMLRQINGHGRDRRQIG
jgi:hypothetical protein